mmetsp:Transcript_84539/g.149694  ORF Transcript_84539/g.149694 Transcript_84539/m.149694 type:complete len:2055 (+) Transcript_84539:34-6198(+)
MQAGALSQSAPDLSNGAVKGKDAFVPGSSFEVKGAGEWYVNGIYTRTTQQVHHADVFRKAGSSVVLMKRGEEGWSLVDLRGSTSLKWSLRAVELYHCTRMPPGPVPPPVGWSCLEGEAPAPMVHMGKSPILPFLTSPPKNLSMALKEKLPQGTSSSWVSKTSRQSMVGLSKVGSSEPRMPRMSMVAQKAGGTVPGLPGLSGALGSLPTSGRRNQRVPPGAVTNFLRSFRVVLTRPNARIPWGFVWHDEPYRSTGSRVLSSILEHSPLERWNVWQQVNGRPDLCVSEGDRLIKADGRWAYHEAEVSLQDSDQAEAALALADAQGSDRALVLEFMRPAVRPAQPLKPRMEVWDTQASLVISWDPPNETMQPYEQVWGWAVGINDLDHNLWYIVDGGNYAARQLSLGGQDVAVIKPELCTVYVSDGIIHGRAYTACVAMLTDNGWSAFSELSRSINLRVSAKVSETVLGLDAEPDEWPQRPRFACPKNVVPGATAPIELRPGPRDLLSQERWIRSQVCIDNNGDGLVLSPADSNQMLLMVDKIVPGSPMDEWNKRQGVDEFHGYAHRKSVEPGDIIKRINGFSGVRAMMYELRRNPAKLIMICDRHCGGNTTFQEVPEAKIFEMDKLDWDASRSVEEFDYHVLMSQAEGVLCARIVEKDADELQGAADAFGEMVEDASIVVVNKGIVQESDRRALLAERIAGVMGEAEGVFHSRSQSRGSEGSRPGSEASSRAKDKRDAIAGSKDIMGTNDEVVLIMLRHAMADISMDEEQLSNALRDFVQSSKVVRNSIAGQELLEKGRALQGLWKWRRYCQKASDELKQAIIEMLEIEAELQDEEGIFSDYSIEDPPYGLDVLVMQIEKCEEYRSELEIQLNEAVVIHDRMHQSNLRFAAEKRVKMAMKDEREDDLALEDAADAAEALGANAFLVADAREQAVAWKANHQKTALHDELFQAVKDLRKHVENRTKPGAGATEQQRMRFAIAGSGLAADNPLVLEAWQLLRTWEQDNVALRAEARLASAVARVGNGFNPDVPEAGDLLGSAIAEVAQQGVDAKFLNDARTSLAFWQASRLQRAEQELATAMRYADEDYLKESLELAKIAGIDEETIETATRMLARLRMVDEVNKMMDKTMEDPALAPLEKAVQVAHSNFFIEEEMEMLCSGSLQARLRFWAQEIQGAVQANQPEGLDHSVRQADACVRQAQQVIEEFNLKQGQDKVPDVAIRTLERDMRALVLVIPGGRDMSNVHLATLDIEKVLLAVERNAFMLPEVIRKAEAQVAKGLSKELVEQAEQAKTEYDATVEALSDAVENPRSAGEDIKNALVQARMAGAPLELVNKAFAKLEEEHNELWEYVKIELELLIAKQEADDITELSAEGRFLRLQDAADAAKNLVPRIEPSILDEVSDISMALAAERSFAMAVQEAKDVLGGKPLGPEEVKMCATKLEHAIQACTDSAQDAAKEGIPEAEDLKELLKEDAEKRQEVLDVALKLADARGTPMRELIISITNARQASVPYEMLEAPYTKLRKKKLDFVTSGLRGACATGKYALAFGLYYRGLALKASEERHGGDWRSGAIEAEIKKLQSKISCITVNGTFTVENSGGSFGTSTWRKNPCYLVRPGKSEPGKVRPNSIKVFVTLAEAGESPATMAVHVVKNNKAARDSGCKNMLVPGFEVLAASNEDDDIPDCDFELPTANPDPIFVVPSAARGELGPYTLIINTTEPVEIIEIEAHDREPQQFRKEFDLTWISERPYAVSMGGGRRYGTAPLLSWYRNPQFRVRLKPPTKEEVEIVDDDEVLDVSPPQVVVEKTEEEKKEEAKLLKIFQDCDREGNGLINKRELIKAVRRDPTTAEFFGLPPKIRQEDGSRDKMEELFQAMDQSGDAEVGFEEFQAFYQVSVVMKRASRMITKEASEVQSLAASPKASKLSGPDEQDVKAAEEAKRPSSKQSTPLLLVHMIKHDGRPKAAPCSIHICRNEDEHPEVEDGFLSENPSFHNVLTCSGPNGKEYSSASEVGAALKLVGGEEQQENIVVVPSLKTINGQGKYKLVFMSTTDIEVDRLQ